MASHDGQNSDPRARAMSSSDEPATRMNSAKASPAARSRR